MLIFRDRQIDRHIFGSEDFRYPQGFRGDPFRKVLIFRDRQTNRRAKAVESEDLTLKTDRHTYTFLGVKITISGQTDGQRGGQTDRQTDGQTDEWSDGLSVVIICRSSSQPLFLLPKVSPERRRRKKSILSESKLSSSSHLPVYGYFHIF